MKRIEFTLGIGFPQAKRKTIEEFELDATDEEIEEAYQMWVNDHLDGSWKVIE